MMAAPLLSLYLTLSLPCCCALSKLTHALFARFRCHGTSLAIEAASQKEKERERVRESMLTRTGRQEREIRTQVVCMSEGRRQEQTKRGRETGCDGSGERSEGRQRKLSYFSLPLALLQELVNRLGIFALVRETETEAEIVCTTIRSTAAVLLLAWRDQRQQASARQTGTRGAAT